MFLILLKLILWFRDLITVEFKKKCLQSPIFAKQFYIMQVLASHNAVERLTKMSLDHGN